MEGETEGLNIASRLSLPGSGGQVWVRCLYTATDQQELNSSALIWTYSCVEDADISAGWANDKYQGAIEKRSTQLAPSMYGTFVRELTNVPYMLGLVIHRIIDTASRSC